MQTRGSYLSRWLRTIRDTLVLFVAVLLIMTQLPLTALAESALADPDPQPVDAQVPSISVSPLSASYTQGDSPAALNVAASVSDGGTLSYQWYGNSVDSTAGGWAAGSGTSLLPATDTVGTTYYYVVITNTNSQATGAQTASATTGFAAITVIAPADDPSPIDTDHVTQLILKYEDPDTPNKYYPVGEDGDASHKWLQIDQKGEKVQLVVYYKTEQHPYSEFSAANGSENLGEIPLVWQSSDNNIATVGPDGVVTPRGNGTVTITATVGLSDPLKYEGTAPYRSVVIIFDGQDGEYVSEVTIIDEEGVDMGRKAGTTKLFGKLDTHFKFYAQITWTDADGNTRVEDTRNDKPSSSVKWSIGGSTIPASINEDTGTLTLTQYSGNAYVICSVTGGLFGETVRDYAQFQLDTGQYEYNPSDSLTLKVVYQEYPDKVVQEHTYSYSELLGSLSSYTYNYTIMRGFDYGCIRAQGFLFKDVMDLEGIKLEEVYQFRFGTMDGYDNPVTYQLLYGSGPRYFFPNLDISSKSGATVVPPMLAYSSATVWNQSEVDPSLALDDGTRFRLVFGPLWSGETNSAYQIYYIHTITVVMAGAPPVTPGDGDDDGGGGGTGDENNGSDQSGDGLAGVKGVNGSAGTELVDPGGADNDATDESGEGAAGALSATDGEGRGWRVYEMMSKAQSQLAPLEYDNPLSPFAAPVGFASVAAGVGFTYLGFKRRLF